MELNLSRPAHIRALLERFGKTASHDLGQNFLADEYTLSEITEAAALSENDTVLEVGPGLGVLTRELAASAGRVISVEVDRSLGKILEYTLSDADNTDIVYADFLKIDIGALVREYSPEGNTFKVAANLPYGISAAAVGKILEYEGDIDCAVLMLQKETAEKFLSDPGSKKYGPLSVMMKYRSNAEIISEVPPDSFYPPPKVDSAVVKITFFPHAMAEEREKRFYSFVKAAFAMRRKTLYNNLVSAGFDKASVNSALAELGLGSGVRAEQVDTDGFINLFRLTEPRM